MLADLEQVRLATLENLDLLDTPPERGFDAIVQLAQRLTGYRIALVSLIDKDRQWFKAKVGLEVDQTPREVAFCAHAVAADDVLIVADATKDDRFCDNPLVTGVPNIRFYAGVPIRAEVAACPSERVPLGTLCVIDDTPRTIGRGELEELVELANLVETLIAARSLATAAVRFAEERGHHLQALERKHRQLRQAERIANIGSWRLTLADNRTEWSEQTYAIHGLPVGDGTPLDTALDFYPPKARALIVQALHRSRETGEPFDIETDFQTAQGEYRRVRSMGELEMDQGQPVAVIGVFQDITARFKLEEALRQAAHTDDLTRIASRGRFNEFLDEKIRAIHASGERCALLLIDLDHFKAVNDRFGHHAGDEVLRVMAARLKADYLSNCFAARLGGDEFVLVIPDQTILGDLPGLLQRLLGDLRYSVSVNGETLGVTATIGASWLGGQDCDRGQLLRSADMALYETKRRRRGAAMIAGSPDLIVPDSELPGEIAA